MTINYRTFTQPRALAVLGGISCIIAMLFALFLQYQLGLEPCKLCYLQRLIVIVLGIVFLCMAIQNPQQWGVRLYAIITSLLCAAGLATAGRHIWLQNLPEDRIPACGPSIDYMLEAFPILDVLKSIWQGAGDCAEIAWQFLGLTIPEQLMIYFIGISILSISLFFIKLDNNISTEQTLS